MFDGSIILNFLLITFLGLLIAFNPSLILVDVFLTLKSKRPVRDTLVLIAGAALPLLIVMAIAFIWLKPDSDFRIRDAIPDIKIPPLIDVLLGASLLAYALKRDLSRASAEHNPSSMNERVKRLAASPHSIFSFAFIRSTLSFTNLLALLAIVKTVIVNHTRPLIAILAVIWALLIGLAPLVVPTVLYVYNPKKLNTADRAINKLLSRNSTRLINLLLIIAGVCFMIHGILQFGADK